MKHLTTDEIIEFVSLDTAQPERLEWALSINEHIRTCAPCLEKVQAFRRLHVEFETMRLSGSYKDFLNRCSEALQVSYVVADMQGLSDADAEGHR